MRTTVRSSLAAALLVAPWLLPGYAVTADTARPLGEFDFSATTPNVSYEDTAHVAGTRYGPVIRMHFGGDAGDSAALSLDTQTVPDASALAFSLGFDDRSPKGAQGDLIVTRDGQFAGDYHAVRGESAAPITIGFDGARTVTLTGHVASGAGDLVLLMPVAESLGSSNAAGGAGSVPAVARGGSQLAPLRLDLYFSDLQPGWRQTARVHTAAGALVELTIAYPSGRKQVIQPLRADASGAYTHTWTVPGGVHGRVTVVASSMKARVTRTFTVE